MAKNRKKQSVAVRFGSVIKGLFAAAFVVLAAVGFLWQKEQIHRLGEDRKERELKLEGLRRGNEELSRAWVILQSPANLDALVTEMRLDLTAPQPEQVVRLIEVSPGLTPESESPSAYAASPDVGADAPLSPDALWQARQVASNRVH